MSLYQLIYPEQVTMIHVLFFGVVASGLVMLTTLIVMSLKRHKKMKRRYSDSIPMSVPRELRKKAMARTQSHNCLLGIKVAAN